MVYVRERWRDHLPVTELDSIFEHVQILGTDRLERCPNDSNVPKAAA